MSNMLNTTNSSSEYLHNYIKKVARKEQESVDTSNVYTGTIIAAASGKYTVNLNESDNSSNIYAISIVSGDIYEKNDYVYLLKADSTSNVNYFIFGKVDAVQETFFNLSDTERFVEDPKSVIEEIAFKSDDIKITVENDNLSSFCQEIKDLGYFKFQAKVEKGAVKEKEKNEKNLPYGFQIQLLYSDGNEGAEDVEVESFTFNSYEFSGQPDTNNFSEDQVKIFHLTSDSVFNKIVISKLSGENKYSTDFTASFVRLVAGSLLEVSATFQNSITVENNRNYFEKGENDLNTVKLASKVYYNNQPLIGDALQYYWFLKDDSAVDSESSDYLNIEGAGNGWRCLNNFQWVNTAETKQKVDANGNLVFDESGNAVYEFVQIRLWDNKNNFIVLNKTNGSVNFSSFVNKAKCIVKYFDNFIESDLIDIYNYENEQFSATLSANVDPVIIINRDDEIQLECKITNNNSKSDLSDFAYKYEWHLIEDTKDTVLTKLKDGLIKVQDKSSTTLKEEDIEDNIREMDNNIEKYYCKVFIYHKNGKVSEEVSNIIQVTSTVAEIDIQEEVQYKYYIADNHMVTFLKKAQTSNDTELSKWSGDWDISDINATSPTWSDGSFDKVFNDLGLFSERDTTKEYFIYYTKRTIVRQGLEILRKETGSFPQIARSVIYGNGGWKNYRVGDNVNQLNTFNQLTNNGEDEGIYYSDIPELVPKNEELDWAITYYKQIVSSQGEISYQPVQLIATIDFREDLEYYIYDNEAKEYKQVASGVDYDESKDYYTEISDNEYQKLAINTQNFDITNIRRPAGVTDLYKNIDNKLFINATYIRSGTLEVKDKFYATIGGDDVRIAGFNVNGTTLESQNGTVGLKSDDNVKTNIAIWAGEQDKDKKQYPFQVTHEGRLNATAATIEGEIVATKLTISEDAAKNAGIVERENLLVGGVSIFDNKGNNEYLQTTHDLTPIFESVGYYYSFTYTYQYGSETITKEREDYDWSSNSSLPSGAKIEKKDFYSPSPGIDFTISADCYFSAPVFYDITWTDLVSEGGVSKEIVEKVDNILTGENENTAYYYVAIPESGSHYFYPLVTDEDKKECKKYFLKREKREDTNPENIVNADSGYSLIFKDNSGDELTNIKNFLKCFRRYENGVEYRSTGNFYYKSKIDGKERFYFFDLDDKNTAFWYGSETKQQLDSDSIDFSIFYMNDQGKELDWSLFFNETIGLFTADLYVRKKEEPIYYSLDQLYLRGKYENEYGYALFENLLFKNLRPSIFYLENKSSSGVSTPFSIEKDENDKDALRFFPEDPSIYNRILHNGYQRDEFYFSDNNKNYHNIKYYAGKIKKASYFKIGEDGLLFQYDSVNQKYIYKGPNVNTLETKNYIRGLLNVNDKPSFSMYCQNGSGSFYNWRSGNINIKENEENENKYDDNYIYPNRSIKYNTWVRYQRTAKPTQGDILVSNTIKSLFSIYTIYGSGIYPKTKNIKIEAGSLPKGYIASYIPAPVEDLSTEFKVDPKSNLISLISKELVINSNSLKLNSPKEGDLSINTTPLKLNTEGFFEIDTTPLKVKYVNNTNYSLEINTDTLKVGYKEADKTPCLKIGDRLSYETDDKGNYVLDIKGQITAESGKIGNFDINSKGYDLYSSNFKISSMKGISLKSSATTTSSSINFLLEQQQSLGYVLGTEGTKGYSSITPLKFIYSKNDEGIVDSSLNISYYSEEKSGYQTINYKDVGKNSSVTSYFWIKVLPDKNGNYPNGRYFYFKKDDVDVENGDYVFFINGFNSKNLIPDNISPQAGLEFKIEKMFKQYQKATRDSVGSTALSVYNNKEIDEWKYYPIGSILLKFSIAKNNIKSFIEESGLESQQPDGKYAVEIQILDYLPVPPAYITVNTTSEDRDLLSTLYLPGTDEIKNSYENQIDILTIKGDSLLSIKADGSLNLGSWRYDKSGIIYDQCQTYNTTNGSSVVKIIKLTSDGIEYEEKTFSIHLEGVIEPSTGGSSILSGTKSWKHLLGLI